jgi:hypothetical protein
MCMEKKDVDKVYTVCMCLHVRSVQLDVLKSKWKRGTSHMSITKYLSCTSMFAYIRSTEVFLIGKLAFIEERRSYI